MGFMFTDGLRKAISPSSALLAVYGAGLHAGATNLPPDVSVAHSTGMLTWMEGCGSWTWAFWWPRGVFPNLIKQKPTIEGVCVRVCVFVRMCVFFFLSFFCLTGCSQFLSYLFPCIGSLLRRRRGVAGCSQNGRWNVGLYRQRQWQWSLIMLSFPKVALRCCHNAWDR